MEGKTKICVTQRYMFLFDYQVLIRSLVTYVFGFCSYYFFRLAIASTSFWRENINNSDIEFDTCWLLSQISLTCDIITSTTVVEMMKRESITFPLFLLCLAYEHSSNWCNYYAFIKPYIILSYTIWLKIEIIAYVNLTWLTYLVFLRKLV